METSTSGPSEKFIMHSATQADKPKKTLQSQMLPWLLVAPCLLAIIIVGISPLFYVLTLAFSDYVFGQPLEFVGFENFIRAFQDERFWHGMRITAWFVVVSVSIQLVLGMITAWALSKIHMFVRYFALTVMLAPMLLAPTLVGLMWKMLFKARFGAIDYLLASIGINGPDWLADPAAALAAVTIADVWQWTPFVTLLLFAGLQNISDEITEAAKVDGATEFQVFWRITLPLLRPFIFLAAFLRIIDEFKTFDVIWGITKGGPGSATESIALYTHTIGFTSFDLSYASAVSIIQLIFIIAIGQVLLFLLKNADEERRTLEV